MKRLLKPLKLMIVTLVMLLFGPYVEGSFISIETDTKTTIIENRLKVEIVVSNRGDEAAFNVVASVDLDGERKVSEIKMKLGVNESFPVEFSYDLKLEMAGRYPLVVTIDYADANMYPFSAISLALFSYKEVVSPNILCKVDNIEITRKGKMNLTIKNLDKNKKDVRVRLALSKELTITNPIQKVVLSPNSEAEVRFDVVNFSALEGSNYPGLAILEYDENERHFSYVSRGLVKIVPEKKFVVKYKWFIIAFISILLVVFFILQFARKKSN